MGLFEKKYCSICGKEIKLLGNRPLQDGNMCVDCVRKLSPWFGGRKQSTVEEIKKQLAYRSANEEALKTFNPTIIIGDNYKFFIDEKNHRFAISNSSNWRKSNPDIINFSDVLSIDVDIDEDSEEVFVTDKDGNDISYDPPKYKYLYTFVLKLSVKNDFFKYIDVILNSEKPKNPGDTLYNKYLQDCKDILRIIQGREYTDNRTGFENGSLNNSSSNADVWYCPKCGSRNEGNFCVKCGEKKPYSFEPFFCSKCGEKIESSDIQYCPKCGNKLS